MHAQSLHHLHYNCYTERSLIFPATDCITCRKVENVFRSYNSGHIATLSRFPASIHRSLLYDRRRRAASIHSSLVAARIFPLNYNTDCDKRHRIATFPFLVAPFTRRRRVVHTSPWPLLRFASSRPAPAPSRSRRLHREELCRIRDREVYSGLSSGHSDQRIDRPCRP